MGVTIRIIDADAAEARLLAATEAAPRAQPATFAAMRSCASRAGPYTGGGTAGAATPWCRTRDDEGGMARP